MKISERILKLEVEMVSIKRILYLILIGIAGQYGLEVLI